MVTQIPDGGVEFTFYRPNASQVAIAGDFNNWQTTFFMTRLPDGRWQSRLQLAPGIYQFRYYADGEWFNDYAAFGLEHGPFGLNSVARVEAPRPPDGPALRTPQTLAAHSTNEPPLESHTPTVERIPPRSGMVAPAMAS